MKLSICIPTYEYNGYSKFLLTRLLSSLDYQTYKNFEIVISDQSENRDVIETIANFNLNIKYIKCDKNGKSSYNVNNAIKNASGDYIKPIWMDDFVLNQNMIKNVVDNLDCYWGAIDFVHMNDSNEFSNYMVPNYTEDVLFGNNRIGGPSVCYFRNDDNFFDESLLWFMDCDFYYRLKQKDNPKYVVCDDVPGMCISIEKQFGSITNTQITNDLIQKETEYLKRKYR